MAIANSPKPPTNGKKLLSSGKVAAKISPVESKKSKASALQVEGGITGVVSRVCYDQTYIEATFPTRAPRPGTPLNVVGELGPDEYIASVSISETVVGAWGHSDFQDVSVGNAVTAIGTGASDKLISKILKQKTISQHYSYKNAKYPILTAVVASVIGPEKITIKFPYSVPPVVKSVVVQAIDDKQMTVLVQYSVVKKLDDHTFEAISTGESKFVKVGDLVVVLDNKALDTKLKSKATAVPSKLTAGTSFGGVSVILDRETIEIFFDEGYPSVGNIATVYSAVSKTDTVATQWTLTEQTNATHFIGKGYQGSTVYYLHINDYAVVEDAGPATSALKATSKPAKVIKR